jgi:hypothetical protein
MHETYAGWIAAPTRDLSQLAQPAVTLVVAAPSDRLP